MIFWRQAWCNLWRNRGRTAITLGALALNTAVLILAHGLLQGFTDQLHSNTTRMIIGEVQLHGPGYLRQRGLYKMTPGAEKVLAAASQSGLAAVPRVLGYGLVSLGAKSAGVQFWGVEPAKERAVFQYAHRLQAGGFLRGEPAKEMVLGKRLAHALKAKVGSEIIVVTQAADGSMGNDLFKVVGILKAVNESMDRNGAIIHEQDFRELFVLPPGWHEIAVTSGGKKPTAKLAKTLARWAPGAEVKTWEELYPGLADLFQVLGAVMTIVGAAFVLTAGLGVMNTMLMATYERKHEFGLLKALGTPPWRIVGGVTAEALLLALLATALGALAGAGLCAYLHQVGLDTRWFAGEFTMAGVAYDPRWRASLTVAGVMGPVGLMSLVCVLAALYPAGMAARLDPVKTLYHV